MRWTLAVSLLVACGEPEPEPVEETDAAPLCETGLDVTWDGWAAGFMLSQCQPCHASETPNRYGAPASVTFDSLEDCREQAGAIEDAVLTRASMPPAGGITDDERALLARWLDCGLP
jgi:uncharacterized membrane protein